MMKLIALLKSLILGSLFLVVPCSVNASMWVHQESIKKENNVYKKEFFIKEGTFPNGNKVKNLNQSKIYIRDMDDNIIEENIINGEIPFNMPLKGSYHIFVQNTYIENRVLHVRLSKIRTYNTNGDIKSSIVKEIRGRTVGSHYGKTPLKTIPFEIIMQKPIKNHHINCCLYSGDIARFQVYFKGKLQNNIPLTVTTQLGWTNSVLPLDDGIISFEIPRDKYVSIAVDKRYMESLLIEANYTTQEAGTYKGSNYSKINYSMTMPLTFHTSPLEYSAKLPAYLMVAGVMLIFALGAYYYRKRKQKFHKEIWFEED